MQRGFSDLEYAGKKKVSRRERSLNGIDAVVPWAALVAELEAFYPKRGKRGRPPIGLERMLRMYISQQCFGFSDEGIEDSIYDSQAIRQFVRINLTREDGPDATTLLKLRRLLERHGLTRTIFEAINVHLAEQGLVLREGTIVDATLIAAPPSTKNRDSARDPETHQTNKGNRYYFGMKTHVGSDAYTGLVQSLKSTAANVADVTQAHHLLQGDQADVLGDSDYQCADKRADTVHNSFPCSVLRTWCSRSEECPHSKRGLRFDFAYRGGKTASIGEITPQRPQFRPTSAFGEAFQPLRSHWVSASATR